MYVGEEMADIFNSKSPKPKIRIIHIIMVVLVIFIIFLIFAIYGFFNQSQSQFEAMYTTGDEDLLTMIETAQFINSNRQPQSTEYLDLTFISIVEDYALHGSPGLLAWSGTDRDAFIERSDYSFFYGDGFYAFGGMRHETPQDIFSVEISNGYSFDLNLLVKIFYNYEEVPFRVLGNEEYSTEFIFTLPALYDVMIPVQLDSQLQVNELLSSRLTVAVFLVPDLHIAEFPEFLGMFNAMALNFEIDYGSHERKILLPPSNVETLSIENLFAGFMINSDLEPTGHTLYVPPYVMRVNPGEIIDLSLIINGNELLNLEEVESYLVISMLDFHQIPMNGEPFLHIYTNDEYDIGQHTRFTIIAPEEPGLYEFTSFVVPNPAHSTRDSNFFLLEFGMRFTIEVFE
ncbi:MAG: hypothetical protein FWE07_02920 [Turicibacter sp.]|nr:hypothetical protein [Turicibacter sp.]